MRLHNPIETSPSKKGLDDLLKNLIQAFPTDYLCPPNPSADTIVTQSLPFNKNTGKFAYVANFGSNTVSVIDTSSNTVVATVPVGVAPSSVAVTPNEKFVYVANSSSSTVSVIDTSSNTVIATVPVGFLPLGVAVTPNSKFAYVTNAGSSTVSVIDTSSNTVVATVPVGVAPFN
ncbi:YncE family protein, partial [Bacillus thuringiensis]|uniref:YncE family protein n=1 Tax=Bacillus thuringiensis TaxID=1428 RepID=UPI002AB4FFFD